MARLKLGNDAESGSSIHESDDDEDFGLGVDIDKLAIDEAQVVLNVCSKVVRFLFRVGIFVRKTSEIDRFQRALKRSEPITTWFEYANPIYYLQY